jgi:hypothetical protein
MPLLKVNETPCLQYFHSFRRPRNSNIFVMTPSKLPETVNEPGDLKCVPDLRSLGSQKDRTHLQKTFSKRCVDKLDKSSSKKALLATDELCSGLKTSQAIHSEITQRDRELGVVTGVFITDSSTGMEQKITLSKVGWHLSCVTVWSVMLAR